MPSVPTAADLVARFPAFAAVPSAAVAAALAEAQTRVDGSWIANDYAVGIMLLAAHTLTLDGYGTGAEAALAAAGAQSFGTLRSGTLHLDRGTSGSNTVRGSTLGDTSYGRRFLALLRVNQPAVAVP